ncbi:MAG: hypothetical protein JNJ61_20200 [Anaerolineae bacterium]|nr:hypothetical protein [Anaerolineae bacterium]
MGRVCLFVLLFVMPFQPVFGQQQSWWEDGCDPRAAALIEPTASQVDYVAACASYRQCDPNGQGDFLCQMRAAAVLMGQCPADDDICRKTAMLYAAAILAFDLPFGESIDWEPSDSIQQAMPLGLRLFQEEDYVGALAAFQMVEFDPDYGDSAFPFSRAIVYEMLRQPEAALAEYERIFSVYFAHPLAWYARVQYYAALGRIDEASFDVAALVEHTKNIPELQTLIQPLAEQYPLNPAIVRDWLSYPVMSIGTGVAGAFYTDMTLEPARPVRLGIFDALDSMFVIGVSRVFGLYQPEEFLRVQLIKRDAFGGYGLSYPTYWENTGGMTLTPSGDIFEGNEFISYFEGGAFVYFLLAPIDAPDPRSGINGQRVCPNGPLSRAKVGMIVTTPGPGSGKPYYDAPGGQALQELNRMTLISGPTCIGEVAWWQGQDENGNTGWIPENRGMEYAFNMAASDENRLIYCPSAPPKRLYVGSQGRVSTGLGANNMRVEAGVTNAVIQQIPEGGVFTVTGGPTCTDGLIWWQVDYGGMTGWTAEGQGDTYWLEVVAASPA